LLHYFLIVANGLVYDFVACFSN